MPAMPHPDKPAVDAGAQAFVTTVAKMRGLPPAERPRLADLDAPGRLTARQWSLDVLMPAAPHLAAAVARVIAADLDARGEHAAATRVHAIAGDWVAATVPDDLSELF